MKLYRYIFKKDRPEKSTDTEPKCGMIPYIFTDKGLEVLLMIPSDLKFGGSEPQIAKGSRDHLREMPSQTADREAEEELGVTKDDYINGDHIHPNKDTAFIFITFKPVKLKGAKREYDFYLFADMVKSKNPTKKPHYETGKIIWLPINDAINQIKANQRHFLVELKQRIIDDKIEEKIKQLKG